MMMSAPAFSSGMLSEYCPWKKVSAPATVLLAGGTASGATTLPTVQPTGAGHPVLEPILAVQSFYRMAAGLSVARGYDPDRPPHLNKVTKTV